MTAVLCAACAPGVDCLVHMVCRETMWTAFEVTVVESQTPFVVWGT